ncbi:MULTISPECIES: integrase core domain-containing protein [Delftia]|uniref:integrase core domain-containing protein n=1 Tax=Delftia TaxID=80865 RepID=UPI0009453FCA|nr:MAG: hypothetical protein DI604_30830 [Delftia acidovorans]
MAAEFIARTVARGVRHLLINAGTLSSPSLERFNCGFHDQRLNEHRFQTLTQADQVITHWRRNYNALTCHPTPPARFASGHRWRTRNRKTLGLASSISARRKAC